MEAQILDTGDLRPRYVGDCCQRAGLDPASRRWGDGGSNFWIPGTFGPGTWAIAANVPGLTRHPGDGEMEAQTSRYRGPSAPASGQQASVGG